MQASKIKLSQITPLDHSTIWRYGLLSRDSGGRWDICPSTPKSVERYLGGFRCPSRQWPMSYFKALTTKKFIKWLIENDFQLAMDLKIVNKEGEIL